MNYYLDAFEKYAVLSGRTSRKEYWMFILSHIIIASVLIVVTSALDIRMLFTMYSLIAVGGGRFFGLFH
jgi:uncharacterized membrane protein YhaH (DUF805 family)